MGEPRALLLLFTRSRGALIPLFAEIMRGALSLPGRHSSDGGGDSHYPRWFRRIDQPFSIRLTLCVRIDLLRNPRLLG